MPKLVRTGVSLEERTVDQLDELADEWNERRSNKVTRSEMARETLPLGIAALQLIDSYQSRRMDRRERTALLRQALHDFDFGDRSESDILIDHLAELEGVDRNELERAILDLKID